MYHTCYSFILGTDGKDEAARRSTGLPCDCGACGCGACDGGECGCGVCGAGVGSSSP